MDKYDRQARTESKISHGGHGRWVLETWDDAAKRWQESPELPYADAREDLADWRDQRAQKLRVSAAFSALGKLGARASSKVMTPAKIAASRRNGKLGGRPKKSPPAANQPEAE